MSFFSWLSRSRNRPFRKSAPTPRRPRSKRLPLQVEELEGRIVLTAPPTVLLVTPADGTTLTTPPSTISVTFSEDVNGAGTASNFALFNSSGAKISFSNDNYVGGTTDTATLTLSNSNLPADTYTLFINGGNITSKADGLPVAQPGQLVFADVGRGNVATVSMPGNGTLGALTNYEAPNASATQATPTAVALADLDGDGLNDLIVASAQTDQVAIFQGQSGGGYSAQPTALLNLPSGAVASGMVVKDFNGDNKPDIVVADSALAEVTLFINQSSGTGDFTFAAGQNVAAGTTPVGIVAADFNLDGKLDVAVADAGADASNNYNVTVLINNGTSAGGFNAGVTFAVGTTTANLEVPTGLAVGKLNNDTKPDLVVSGTGGIAELLNTTPTSGAGANVVAFSAATVIAASNTTSVATGVLDANAAAGGVVDVLATTTANSGQLLPFLNNGSGVLTAAAPIAAGAATPTALALQDLTGSGRPNPVYVNDVSSGTLNDLPALQTGFISLATNTAPIVITTPGTTTGLQNGQEVIIQGVGGDTAANGTFYISNVTAVPGPNPTTTFTLNGSNGTASGTYTANTGTWIAVPFVITNVTNANAPGSQTGTITVTTTGTPPLVNGQQVTISNVTGDTAANNTWYISNVTTAGGVTTFTLNGSNGNGAFTAPTDTTKPPLIALAQPYLVDASPVALALDASGNAVVANSASQDVSVLLADGNGTFLQSNNMALVAGAAPRAVAVADLNKDGIPDLVVADTGANNVTVFLGLAGGGYGAGTTYSTNSTSGKGPVSVALADLNGDGLPDIITANSTSSTVSVLLNSTATPGTFGSATTFATGSTPTGVVAADVNNDGVIDLLVSHNGGGFRATPGVSVLLGKGNGTFSPETEVNFSSIPGGVHPTALAVGDFNKDGFIDAVVADANPSGSGRVIELLGNGTGSFAAQPAINVGVNPTAIAVGDLNADGFLDVVTVSGSTTTTQNISVLLNSAGTGFATAKSTTLSTGYPIASVAIAHVSENVYPDLVIGLSSHTITGASNAGPIVITSNGHGLVTGDVVTIVGVQGNTAANGVWTVTVPTVNGRPDANHFSLNGSTGNGAFKSGTGFWFSGSGSDDNVYTLLGNGDGSFGPPQAYSVGGQSIIGATSPPVPPSSVAVVSDPFVRLSTFTTGGSTLAVNLVVNPSFEVTDLAGEKGNLDGWQTFNLSTSPGSAGAWSPQTGTLSPLSGTTVPGPTNGAFQAMLDEQNLVPIFNKQNTNTAASYAGSHALYQDIFIPSNATSLTLTMSLYLNDSGSATGFSDPTTTDTPTGAGLNWNTVLANQQVRVDLVNPNDTNGILDVNTGAQGVLQNIFQTQTNTPGTETVTLNVTFTSAQLSQYAGKTIRLRVAAANNQGQLLVGVDNVKMTAIFADLTPPTLTGVQLRNPNFLASPNTVPQSTDPTIIGQVGDIGSVNAISFVDLDMANNGFGGPDDVKITQFDAAGNFSFTPTGLLPGVYTVPVEVVDKAGNINQQAISFTIQGPSLTTWQETGPGPIDISSANFNYTTVTGNITSIVVDPNDPSGNTIFAGSDNGGVWRSIDGGNDWLALTDNVFDPSGNRIPETIGALAIGNTIVAGNSQEIIYAGTGVANTTIATGGNGILKSIDGGSTWTVVGQTANATTNFPGFKGAHISSIVVDPNNANTVYVAVSWFDNPANQAGVFLSTDGGKTWADVMTPANMFSSGLSGGPLAKGTQLASVTDLVLDPFNPNRLIAGLGNIGETGAANATAGVWLLLPNHSTTPTSYQWVLQKGGDNGSISNNTLPSGAKVGRVTVAIGDGKPADEATVYVLIATPPVTSPPRGTFEAGTITAANAALAASGNVSGLYKTKDNFLNFTQVLLTQNDPASTAAAPVFDPIGLAGENATEVGAMIVDPTDPNVVYIGGSTSFTQGGDPPQHGVIRVDTGDMRDTTYTDPNTGKIPNDGDDIQKVLQAERNDIFQGGSGSTGTYPAAAGSTEPGTLGPTYKGEGVYWYDLAEAGVNGDGRRSFLPTSINTIVLDPKGRLLFGTEEGIWRGVPDGFSYDFTTGANGVGVLARGGGGGGGGGGNKTPNPPGMSFTSLNGNLEIADLTSVAIDPTAANTYYTTQLYTGTATVANAGPLDWVTMGLTGPNDALLGNLNVPNASEIRATAPAPNAPTGTQTTLYLAWQFLNPNGLELNVSNDAGQSFNQTISAGISLNDGAGTVLPFAINPTKAFDQTTGTFFDQILFGTNRVYLTETSTNVFDPISPVLSSTGNVSALAFAPSATGVYYAGTTDGLIFVEQAGGSFTKASTGLPATGARINNITVSPTNAAVAFAMLTTTTGGGVWETTNSGAKWTQLTGLPNQPAYALVDDTRPTQAAPSGSLYVGTQVGAFVSLDGGTTWSPLGKGLPSAPVVDLQLNTTSNELAAAVQGRGVFELSTRTSGPVVVATTPTTPQNTPLTSINVTFDEPVDPRSFGLTTDTAARSQVAAQITNNPAALTNMAIGLYQELLRGAPTTTELNTTMFNPLGPNLTPPNLILQAFGELSLISDLVSSQEYYNDAVAGSFPSGRSPAQPTAAVTNANNATWLTQAYVDLFGVTSGQAPSTPGYSIFLTAVDGGNGSTIPPLNRQQVVLGLLQQNQALANLSARIFNQILGDAKPDGTTPGQPAPVNDPDLVPWEAVLGPTDHGTSPIDLVLTLLGSEPFYLTDGNTQSLAATPTGVAAQPSAVTLADLTGNVDAFGNPIPDLIVADQAQNKVYIFQGQVGGGYANTTAPSYYYKGTTPTYTLVLPSGSKPDALAVGNFSGHPANANMADIAVADLGTNNVIVFTNMTTSGGPLAFDAGTTFSSVGNAPIALAVGNFDSGANNDLAVLDSVADNSNHYDVTFLYGTGISTLFSASTTTINTGFSSAPTGFAQGLLNNDSKPDLAISGSGVRVLLNTTTTPGSITFSAGTSISTTATTSVAIGSVDTTTTRGIVATSDVGGGEVLVFQSTGGSSPTFSLAGTFGVGASPRAVHLQDLNGDGLNDIEVVNDVAAGTFTVLTNTTVPAMAPATVDTVTFAAPVTYSLNGSNPVALALGDTNQDAVLDAVTANSGSASFTLLPGTRPGMFLTPSDINFIDASTRKLMARPATTAELNTYVPMATNNETVYLSGPGGPVAPVAITPTDASDQTFTLTFPVQTLDGSYTLVVGPSQLTVSFPTLGIRDLIDLSGSFVNTGNPMNQNRNLVNGEFPGDRFSGPFAINTSDDGLFITGLFNDLDGAQSNTQGFLNLVGPVDTGRTQALLTTAATFTTSTAYRTDVIYQIYNAVLQRNPTTGTGSELATALSGLSNGTQSELQLEAMLVGSQEFFDDATQGFSGGPHGTHTQEGSGDTAGDTAWLKLAFQVVVGRQPTAAETASLVQLLDNNQITVAALASGLEFSGESLRRVTDQLFVQFLGRDPVANPDPTRDEATADITLLGKQSFTAGQPSPYEQAIDSLLSSPEYLQHVGNTNQAWAASLYAKLPGSPMSEPSTAAATVDMVLSLYTAQRQTAIQTVVSSPAYQANLITNYYNTYLGVPPSATDIANYQAAFKVGLRDESALATILSSGNYFPLSGPGSSNVTYLNKVYNALLLTSPNTSDPTYQAYLNYLNSNSGTAQALQTARYNVLYTGVPGISSGQPGSQGLLFSDAYRRILLAGFFNTYLAAGKTLPPPANDADVNALLAYMNPASGQTSAMNPGKTQEQVLVQLLSDALALPSSMGFGVYPSGLTNLYFLQPHPFP